MDTEYIKNINYLIDTEYSITTNDIEKILGVSSEWIRKNIKPNVSNVSVKEIIGTLKKVNSKLSQSYYYFSINDFKKWLAKNIILKAMNA